MAEFVCTKLYRHFIHSNPDQEFVGKLAELFIASNWELLPVFKALFKSEHFFETEFINAVIKNPVHCFIDFVRLTGISAANVSNEYGTFRYGASNLGMEIFNPINVAGWQEHHEWINENTLTQRWNYCKNILGTFTNEKNRESMRTLAINLAEGSTNNPDFIVKALTLHFLGRVLDENLHQSALAYFKGDILKIILKI
ncbi:MAG: DUF1800 family protein [Saprospiraceae bacterium]|nr:DUF1800 family protein [Saprospiraceae bacterium]